MLKSLRPSELLNKDDVRLQAVDLDQLPANRTLGMAPLKQGRYAARVLLRGALATDGIDYRPAGEFPAKYSLGIQLENEEDYDALEQLLNTGLDEAAKSEDINEWVTRPLFKNGILYLKCKTDKAEKQFLFSSNVKLAPKKPSTEIMRDMPVQVEAEMAGYFGTEDATRGLTFTVRYVHFDTSDLSQAMDESTTENSPPPVVPTKRASAPQAGAAPAATRGPRVRTESQSRK